MYDLILLGYFEKQIKKLSKRFLGIKKSLVDFLLGFDKRNAISLGDDVYKIRFRFSNLNKGKRNSFRIYILLIEEIMKIIPIFIHYKGDIESISRKELNYYLSRIYDEL